MLVKKFEAKTMKQAIEMVKQELGPEAIILGAKENERGFGLMGENSIEVTAAISESKYYEKKAAEKKLSSRARQTYAGSSARTQKNFIQKATKSSAGLRYGMTAGSIPTEEGETADAMSATPAAVVPPSRRQTTQRQYIEIDDEESASAAAGAGMETYSRQTVAAATSPSPKPAFASQIDAEMVEDTEILRLKEELNQLKGMLSQFRTAGPSYSTAGFQSHPGAEEGISFELSFAYEKMMNGGLNKELVIQTLKTLATELTLEQRKKRPVVEGWLVKYFLNKISVSTAPTSGRYHVFLGATGQGKTSAIVKFASHLVMKEKKKVAVLSGDSVKVGAQDQLRIYCQILNIPFGAIDGEVDWARLDQQLKGVDVILIDSAGVNLKGAGEVDLVRRVIPKNIMQVKRIHYVQSIMARDHDAAEILERFKLFEVDDIIFTRLDEAVQFGSVVNFMDRFHLPIHSFSTSAEIPDGFEFASKERIIDLIFGLSKVAKVREA